MMFWLVVAVLIVIGFAGAWWLSGRSKGDAATGISDRATRTQAGNIVSGDKPGSMGGG